MEGPELPQIRQPMKCGWVGSARNSGPWLRDPHTCKCSVSLTSSLMAVGFGRVGSWGKTKIPMRSETGLVRSRHSTSSKRPAAESPPYPGPCSPVDARNSIPSSVKLIPKPEPPFIQVYCYFVKSFTYIISINFKLALWAGVTGSQFTEEETEGPKVYARWGDSAGFQPRCTSFHSQPLLSTSLLHLVNLSVLKLSTL